TTRFRSELLEDPRWQKKRTEILNRDHFRCRCCESPHNTLHVHHMYYLKGRMPWEYEDDSLITLCEHCHANVKKYNWQKAFMDLNLTPKQLLEIALEMKFYFKKRQEEHEKEKQDGKLKHDFNPSVHMSEGWVAVLKSEEELNEYYRDYQQTEREKYIND